jgi:branched-chain amino acid transport system substrate-binding protein
MTGKPTDPKKSKVTSGEMNMTKAKSGKMSNTIRAALRASRIAVLGLAPIAAIMAAGEASAQSAEPVRIGILNDMSGPTSDLSGTGAWASAELALEDFGATVLGRPIQLLRGDHQAKADVGITLARKFYDEGVNVLFDIGITTVALGVQQLARDKNKIVVFTSTGTADLTGKFCSPNGIHWTYDSYAMAVGAARANMQTGLKNWFFMTADYAYGYSLQAEATKYILPNGGTIVGDAKHPFDTKDFSSDILKAQSSRAELIALATPTFHAATIIKQAAEFGFKTDKTKRLAPFGMLMSDVKAVGLDLTQGLFITEPFYWDQTEATRAFSKRFQAKYGKMPNSLQASVYGAVTHYLKAVKSANSDKTEDVLKAMRDAPVNDFMTKDGVVRPDGRMVRDFYVFRVKTPAESKGEWDLLEQVSTIPGNDAFKAPDPSACNLVK